jgi:hypothetical protein
LLEAAFGKEALNRSTASVQNKYSKSGQEMWEDNNHSGCLSMLL